MIASAHQAPKVEPLRDVKPIKVWSSDDQTRQMVRHLTNLHGRLTNTIELALDGRLIREHGIVINAKNEIEHEFWIMYGAMEVYDASAVPASVFERSQKSREVCHE